MSEGQSISVVVVDRDPASRTAIKHYLSRAGAKVVGETESMAVGINLVTGMRPDILVLEVPPHPGKTLFSLRGLKNDVPRLGVIVTASDSSPQLILRSMRAGAQEFLSRPVGEHELGQAVKRLAGMISSISSPKKKPGKIITVFSRKGGVGVTSIATNLAVSFSRNKEKHTALVDLNMQMAEVALHLDLAPEYTICDAMGTGNVDESRLKGLLTEHESGVCLLSTPEDPVEAEMITPDLLLEVFSLLRNMFDVIIVDAGHFFDSRVMEVLSLADAILVIAGLDVPTLRNLHRCFGLFRELGYDDGKVRLIVNREQKKSSVTVEDLEETVESKVFRQMPSDYKALISAIDAGVPAVIQNPKAKISRSILELTDDLCRLYVDEGAEEEASGLEDPAEHTSAA